MTFGREVNPQKVKCVPPNFKHFLIELKCLHFLCGLGPPFLMRLFRIFEIGAPLTPLNPRKSNSSFMV